jgi:hypothetical protein
MALARQVKALRAGVESPLNVNVVYQIPGEVLQIDFTGVRTGRYSASKHLLLVQAAVPAEPIPESNDFLLGLLQSAIEEAERFAVRRRIAEGPLTELRELIEALKAA